MKSTLYDWRKQNVAHMKRTHEAMCVQRDGLSEEIEAIVAVIAALESVKLKRPPKVAPPPGVKSKPKRKLSEAHKQALANGRKKWAEKNGHGNKKKSVAKKAVTNA